MAKVKKDIERITSPSSSLSAQDTFAKGSHSTGFYALKKPIPADGLAPQAAVGSFESRRSAPFSGAIKIIGCKLIVAMLYPTMRLNEAKPSVSVCVICKGRGMNEGCQGYAQK